MQFSAGILLYRIPAQGRGKLEVFLVHPGGPFFARNDKCWGIPKGLQEENEELIQTAVRELTEETCIQCHPELVSGSINLGSVIYNNKTVYCFAILFNNDIQKIKSNLTPFGWPEIDKGQFFDIETAKTKISKNQLEFLIRLQNLI